MMILIVFSTPLFQEYQRSLPNEQQSPLEGAIALLEQTKIIIDVFADLRPIKGTDDTRLKELQGVTVWFMAWEDSVSSSTLNKKEQKEALLTRETMDDTMSVLLGFGQLCKDHFAKSIISIVPGRVNSDICENLFCQQRAMCHGANDNPTHSAYTTGLNTIILSQAPISRKSKAFGSADPMVMHSTLCWPPRK